MLRRFTAGAALAVAAVTLAGCGSAGTVAAPAASPTPEAASVLAAAVTKTSGIDLRLVLVGDTAAENISGVYQAAGKIASIAQGTGAGSLRIVVTSDDLYLSGLADFKGQTVHLKIVKLRPESPLAVFADVLTPLPILTAAKDVVSTGTGAFSGTVDLTQVQTSAAGTQKFLDHVVKAGGDKAKRVAFTALVNAAGYLTDFQATLPNLDSGKDADYHVTLSAFGQPVTVHRPTGKNVVEAPAAMYTAT